MTTELKRRLTPKEWAKAETMYESGEFTLDQIADEFGVHTITVQRHMKSKGIEKGSRADAVKRRLNEKMDKEIDEDAEVLKQRIKETKEEHYRLNKAIDGRLTREIVLTDQEGRQIASTINNVRALKLIAETLKITRENRYVILGVDAEGSAEDELPTLEVREMWEEEIEAIRNQQRAQAEEMGLDEEDIEG